MKQIAMNLSDGTTCYGKPTNKRNEWWLRRTNNGPVFEEFNAAAPSWARQQAEAALVRGWAIGDVIKVQP